MGIYRFEAVNQDLVPIKKKVNQAFTSQVNRLKIETSTTLVPETPGRQLVTDIKDFWTQAKEGYVMSQNMDSLRRYPIDTNLMLGATRNLSFDDFQDTLLNLGISKLKDNPHATPRLSTYGVALVTLAELSRQGLTTLASLDLPYEQTQDIPDARLHPHNWSRDLTPDNIWQSMFDLNKWSQIGLIKSGSLSRTEVERVVAASQFFGWANFRLQQTLPSAA